MDCPGCGEPLRDGGRVCPRCGTDPTAGPDAPARRRTGAGRHASAPAVPGAVDVRPDERVVLAERPDWTAYLGRLAALTAAVLLAFVATLSGTGFALPAWAVAVAGALWIWWWRHTSVYALTDRRLIVDRNEPLARSVTVPLDDVEAVGVEPGPLAIRGALRLTLASGERVAIGGVPATGRFAARIRERIG